MSQRHCRLKNIVKWVIDVCLLLLPTNQMTFVKKSSHVSQRLRRGHLISRGFEPQKKRKVKAFISNGTV